MGMAIVHQPLARVLPVNILSRIQVGWLPEHMNMYTCTCACIHMYVSIVLQCVNTQELRLCFGHTVFLKALSDKKTNGQSNGYSSKKDTDPYVGVFLRVKWKLMATPAFLRGPTLFL